MYRTIVQARAGLISLFLIALVCAAPVSAQAESAPVPSIRATFFKHSSSTLVRWHREAISDSATSRVRIQRGDGTWGPWSKADQLNLELKDSFPGENLKVRFKNGDVIDTFKAVALPPKLCPSSEPNRYSETMPITPPETTGEQPAATLTFSHGVTVNEVQEAIGAKTEIVETLVSRPIEGRTRYTAGFTTDEELGFDAAYQLFLDFVSDDALEYANDLSDEADPTERSAATELSQSSLRKISIDAAAGSAEFNLDQVKLSGDASEIEEVFSAFGGTISDALLVPGDGECASKNAASISETDNYEIAPAIEPVETAHDLLESDQQLSQASTNPRVFTPSSILVKAYNRVYRTIKGKRRTVRKAVLEWKWCTRCTRFWDTIQNVERYQRQGVEIQLDMNRDGDGAAWGRPPWVAPPKPNTNGKKVKGVPRAWSANFQCAYPDDYTEDDLVAGVSLTIGTYCPPSFADSPSKWRWAHVLLQGKKYDKHDGVRPSVQAVEWASTDDQKTYCALRSGRPGGCMFGLVPAKSYAGYVRKAGDDRSMLVTPGKARFYRGGTSSGGGDGVPPEPLDVPYLYGSQAYSETYPVSVHAAWGSWATNTIADVTYEMEILKCSQYIDVAESGSSGLVNEHCLPAEGNGRTSITKSGFEAPPSAVDLTVYTDPDTHGWLISRVVALNEFGQGVAYSYPANVMPIN